MTDDVIRLGLLDEEEILLDEAALSLAALDHPAADAAPYHDVFDAIAARLTAVGSADTAQSQASALARVLGDEFGFAGDTLTYDDPANADMIRVIDRQRGLPISLSILYVAAARRIGWTANVLDVPGHVLVLIGMAAAPVVIDPFHGGGPVERDRLRAMLATTHAGRVDAASQVAAMPNRAILVRLLFNQARRAESAGQGRRALDLYRRMTTIAPAYGQGWWERARLERVDADAAAARISLSAMLEVTREPIARREITRLLAPRAPH